MASKRKRPSVKAAEPVPAEAPAAAAPVLGPPLHIRPRVGLHAPNFETEAVLNGEFKTVRLSDYTGRYLVLLFYPLDFTFVCPTEIVAFNDRYFEFEAANAAVLAVSVDSKFTHNAWTKTPRNAGGVGTLKFPLASDVTKQMSRHYDVLIEHGADAGLFLIDTKGVLRSMLVNDLPVGRSVNETLRLIKAFQFADEHGEVCPAEWTPGKPTMKADPVGSQAYFNQIKPQ